MLGRPYAVVMLLALAAGPTLSCAASSGQRTGGSPAVRPPEAQSSATPDPSPAPSFEMTLAAKGSLWDSRKPLVADVLFRNTGARSVFLNLESAFQFYGFLEDEAGHVFGVEWSPVGAERTPVKEDYKEILPGDTLVFTITSRKIRAEVAEKTIPWRSRRRGAYTLYVQFASGSKKYLMPNQWEGTLTSNDVRIEVR